MKKQKRLRAQLILTLNTGLRVYGTDKGALLLLSQGAPVLPLLAPIGVERISAINPAPPHVKLVRYSHQTSFFNVGFDETKKPPCYWWLCSDDLLG